MLIKSNQPSEKNSSPKRRALSSSVVVSAIYEKTANIMVVKNPHTPLQKLPMNNKYSEPRVVMVMRIQMESNKPPITGNKMMIFRPTY